MSSSIVQLRSFLAATKIDRVPKEDGISSNICSACDSVPGGRQYNEDRFYCCDESQLYMVVDGMGGHRGGALASQIAVETIPQCWVDGGDFRSASTEQLQAAFQRAARSAADEMSAVASRHFEYDRMGCTLGAVLIVNDQMHYCNIGDCRVYLLRNRELSQLTKDQTLVQGLVDASILTASEANTHRWRHIVTNSVSAMGIQEPPVLNSTAVCNGDRVLITSDGMPDELSRREIEQIMVRCADPQSCVDQLIAKSLRCNARDNVTCVVIDV